MGPGSSTRTALCQYSARNFPTVANQLFEALMLHKFLPGVTKAVGGVIYDDDASTTVIGDVDWLSGAVLLVRRDAP